MGFEFTSYGISAAAPIFGRHQATHILSINNKPHLIDCGDGAQTQLVENKVSIHGLEHIFISHLHGDHFFGLIGLLSTLHLQGHDKAINIYGPKELAEIITIQLKHSRSVLAYPLHFHPTTNKKIQLLVDAKTYTVESFPLKHRVPCCGFLFKEKPKLKRINKEKMPHWLSIEQINQLTAGEDLKDEKGKVQYKNEEFTLPAKKSLSFAYCSDTAYHEGIISAIENCDLLYHEATFSEDMKERAKKTYHSTAEQAATIAKKAKVDKLIIGHFSGRFKELVALLEEAKTIFPNTECAEEGKTFAIEA